jgi:DNA-binding GntR family transcriptional regulator
VKRSLLKDQIADLLREKILIGQIPQGTRMVERDIANVLNVSRIPVRDALLQLESEGLIENFSSGRKVITLKEKDLIQINQIRTELEKLAVKLFIQIADQTTIDGLDELLREMNDAFQKRDLRRFIDCDIRIHQYIWKHNNNEHLNRILNSLLGPISIIVSNHATKFDWEKTKLLHDELIACIKKGDIMASEKSIEIHMADSLERSMICFHDQDKNETHYVSELALALEKV